MARIGVMGGTFDPIHVGHLVAADAVRHELRLDEVLLVVANHPWQKADRHVTAAELRLAMVADAVAGVEGLSADRTELDLGGPSYMVETLAELRRRRPGDELHLLVGTDVAELLETWERPDELRRLARLVVLCRAGAESKSPPPGWEHDVVHVPALEISSELVRARLAAGAPVRWLVPDPVLAAIERLGLYGRR